ncbi:MAG: RNA-directed DNA polymerase, partial [Bacteroidales bacterium]|nr:RNA-directed DNA polymerase [Bacteroidales bacterium]
SHQILMQKLETIFKDKMLLYVFYQIIDSYQLSATKVAVPNLGLPIGNLTSQYFANFYLAGFDRFIKQKLMIKPYTRYMDDFIIWANNAQELNNILGKIENYLNENLDLTLKIKYINTTKYGLNFLSYRIFENRIELQSKAKKRFIKKINIYEQRLKKCSFTQSDYQRHALPLIAFTEHASAKGFRKKVFGY